MTSDPFDPNHLQLTDADRRSIKTATKKRRASKKRERWPIPKPRKGERFLRALVPWPWLEKAASLDGAALAVGLHVWQIVGALRHQPVRLSQERMSLGISVWAARRAINRLEKARLLKVWRELGCSLRVALLETPAPKVRNKP
jgi:hypothetical protein